MKIPMTRQLNRILIYLVITSYLAESCGSESKVSVANGEKIYREKCAFCHGTIRPLYENAPSLLRLNEYDSAALLSKLSEFGSDSIHRLNNFSKSDANSMYQYIRVYFQKRY